MIEVINVTKKYGNFVAVNNINFAINKGEIVGFLGPNGAGKTTTMNMITGYIEPTEGKIIVNGYLMEENSKKAKRCIGYMPENVPLYQDFTVKEFIKFMQELKNVSKFEAKDEIEKIMKQTGLEEVSNKLIKNLSRGYKQRVSLAGALVGNPEVLILDEPTVGLDPKQITQIRELIKSLGKTHTIILSSHILSEVSQICEKVIIINKGEIVEIDSPKNLEEKLKDENQILITVEDKQNKIEKTVSKITDIKELKLLKDNEDGTKTYQITSNEKKDLRKDIFENFAKENITIFEMKKKEITLEDAFIKLITDEKEEKNNA